MNFDINIDPLVWICLAVAALASLLAFWTRFIPIWYAGSAVDTTTYDSDSDSDSEEASEDQGEPEYETAQEEKEAEVATVNEDSNESEDIQTITEEPPAIDDKSASNVESYPKLSVIVYAYTEFEETKKYLEMLMSQDYPNFEVILINEGSADTLGILQERMGNQYDNLYITFIPHDAHNLSRRKLAYTIGMKAASGEIALTTASNCLIPSRRWLSEMMLPFVEDGTIDIVLGYSHIDFRELRGAGKWYRQMDATLTACQWIGSAQMGKPYRGDCFNLAYRRELFFQQKGYSRTIHLVNGDDDIFLTPIMDGYNTAVAISPDTILTTEWDEVANRVLASTKERYQFTSQLLPQTPFIRAGIGSLMQWLILLSAVGAALAALPSYLGIIIAAVFLIIVWTSEILIYRRAARRLESICLWWSFPFFLLWLPIGNFIFKTRRRSQRRKNYTFA
ncbi:MAG: glycosyltransferase [Muribaculaceae bacterium]|nr:glycosyltransferase [Muribaculaceae bacterium]